MKFTKIEMKIQAFLCKNSQNSPKIKAKIQAFAKKCEFFAKKVKGTGFGVRK